MLSAILECCGGRFSNPLFSFFLLFTIILHGDAGAAHALTVKFWNDVR